MNRKNFLEGAVVLFVSTFIVKIVGAFYRIPLTDILGGEGMGYYSSAFNLFTPAYALCAAGLPIAVSHVVARKLAQQDETAARSVVYTALVSFGAFGTVVTLGLYGFARHFSELIHNPGSFYAIVCLAPTLFLSCIMAVLRGATQGRQNMNPTAVSQLIEAFVKLALGVTLAYFSTYYLLNVYSDTHMVLGTVYPSTREALSAITPLAAAAAIAGVSLSNLVGLVYLLITSRRCYLGGRYDVAHLKSLVAIAFPVALSAVVINLTSLIDLTTIMAHLEQILEHSPDAFYSSYPALNLEAKPPQEIPNFLYGSYSGVAMSVFHLVPSLTVALGISVIPVVTTYAGRGDSKNLKNAIETVMRFTALLAAPAGFGVAALAEPILRLLYPTREQEIAIAAPMLTILGFAAFFVAILIPLNAVMQALGRPDLPVKLMLIGAAVKFTLNMVLVARPQLNIQGAPYATLICYGLLVVLSGITLSRVTGFNLHLLDMTSRAVAGGGISALAAFATQHYISDKLGRYGVFLSIGVSVVVFLMIVPIIRVLRKQDLQLLPFFKKLPKPLDFMFKLK